MTGRELPDKNGHIVARVPAPPVFGTLFSLASVGQAGSKGMMTSLLAAAFVQSWRLEET